MGNKGSVVVEMCLVAPILICVIFVVMNMFILAMNSGISEGESRVVLYNRQEYRIDENGEGNTGMAENVMKKNMDSSLVFASDVTTDIDIQAIGGSAITGVRGKIQARVEYDETFPGTGILIADGMRRRSAMAQQELRNVGDNLRRWQIYGRLLSE